MKFKELVVGDHVTKFNYKLQCGEEYKVIYINKTLYSTKFILQHIINGKYENLYIVKEYLNKETYPENCDDGYLVRWEAYVHSAQI